MTSKNPVRSCEDVDEAVLSYAEIKALCVGDPRIKEKMELDIKVSKLRMLEGEHKKQQYQLQDKILKYFPQETKRLQERVVGLEKDVVQYASHSEEKFNMKVLGTFFGEEEKKEAGTEILKFFQEVQASKNAKNIGTYKGFNMTMLYNPSSAVMELLLKADGVTHRVELSESALGNITRIDNALAKIPEHLDSAKNRIEDIKKQTQIAQEELQREFPQAEELKEKFARLSELNTLLSLDSSPQEEKTQETEAESESLNCDGNPEAKNPESNEEENAEEEDLAARLQDFEETVESGQTKKHHLELMRNTLILSCPDEDHPLRKKAREIMVTYHDWPEDGPVNTRTASRMLQILEQSLVPQSLVSQEHQTYSHGLSR
jgi:hypothetical protein